MKEDFKNIIEKHNGILYKIGRSYTLEESDFKDLYQEMLIQIWKSLDSFKGNSKTSTWIYRVALNTALVFKRKGKKHFKTDSIDNLSFKIADESLILRQQSREKESRIELLYQCINQLKKEERAIILLHLEGKKYEEIAEVIGLTTSHVGVKIKRTKDRLYKLLQASNYERI